MLRLARNAVFVLAIFGLVAHTSRASLYLHICFTHHHEETEHSDGHECETKHEHENDHEHETDSCPTCQVLLSSPTKTYLSSPTFLISFEIPIVVAPEQGAKLAHQFISRVLAPRPPPDAMV